MKLIFKKAIVLCIIVLSPFFYLEYQIRAQDESRMKVLKLYLDNHSEEIEGLILGPSHMRTALNPAGMGYHIASLAMSGSAINIDYLLFQKYKHLPNLKFLIFDLSKGYLDKQNSSEWMRSRKLFYYFGVLDGDFEIEDAFLFKHPIWAYLEPRRHNNEMRMNAQGFYEQIDPEIDKFSKVKYDTALISKMPDNQRVIDKHNLLNEDFYAENILLLNELIFSCKEKNIQVLFISPPKYKYYNDNLRQEHIQRREAFIDKVVDNKTVFFFDYESFFGDSPAYFYNINHMNVKGGQTFTTEVNSVLEEVLRSSPNH